MEGAQGRPVGWAGIGKCQWAQSPRKASERDQSTNSLLPSWGLASPSMKVGSTEVLVEPLDTSLTQLLPHPPTHERNKCEGFASNPPFLRAPLLCLPHCTRAQLSECGIKHRWAPTGWEEAAGLWRGCWAEPHPAERAGDMGQTSLPPLTHLC